MQIILLKILVHYYYLRKWTKCSASFILLRFQCTCIVEYALLPIQCIIERVAHTERKKIRDTRVKKYGIKTWNWYRSLSDYCFHTGEKRNVCKSVLGLRKSRLFPLDVFFSSIFIFWFYISTCSERATKLQCFISRSSYFSYQMENLTLFLMTEFLPEGN